MVSEIPVGVNHLPPGCREHETDGPRSLASFCGAPVSRLEEIARADRWAERMQDLIVENFLDRIATMLDNDQTDLMRACVTLKQLRERFQVERELIGA